MKILPFFQAIVLLFCINQPTESWRQNEKTIIGRYQIKIKNSLYYSDKRKFKAQCFVSTLSATVSQMLTNILTITTETSNSDSIIETTKTPTIITSLAIEPPNLDATVVLNPCYNRCGFLPVNFVFQQRCDGSVDFYRNYTQYEKGFGDIPNGEFWMGNTWLHETTLTNKYKLRVELEMFNTTKGWAEYLNFAVGPSSDHFRLTISGYNFSSTAGDSLTSHNNFPFQASDYWITDINCAKNNKGAWWFDQCYSSHLNGLYSDHNLNPDIPYGIDWATFNFYNSKYNHLKCARMILIAR